MKNSSGSANPINILVAEYNFYKASTNEKLIAQTLLKNVCNIPNWTIEETAACCNISISTCRRFIKTLGYESYSEFRMKLTECISKYDFDSPPDIDIHNLATTEYLENAKSIILSDINNISERIDPASIIRISEMLYASQYIYIHDLLKNGMRLPLIRNLALTRKDVTMSYDIASQIEDAKNANTNSVYLLVYDGMVHSQEIPNTIKIAHERGAKIIVLSIRKTFPNIGLCDEVLYIGKGSSTISNMLLYDLVYQYISEMYKCLYITGKKLI